jgi:Cu/Ag efflux protein CusF
MLMPNRIRLNARRIAIATVAASFVLSGAPLAIAQNAKADDSQQAVAAGVVAHLTAHVVGIDAVANSVTLMGPRGNVVEVVVDPDVGDVSQLKVGDAVEVAYKNALLIRAEKTASNGIRERIETDATTLTANGATTSVRSIQVVATVQKIDRKLRIVTLRGPERTVMVEVPPEIALQNLKVGENVRAEFVSAAAVQITRGGMPIK